MKTLFDYSQELKLGKQLKKYNIPIVTEIDINSLDIIKDCFLFYCNFYYGNIKTNKTVELITGDYLTHITGDKSNILMVYSQIENISRHKMLKLAFNENFNDQEKLYQTIFNEFNNLIEENLIVLSTGHSFPITEYILKNCNIKNKYSICFNPAKVLIQNNSDTITKFLYYDNAISNIYPSELILLDKKVKSYFPNNIYNISYSTENIPLNEEDRYFPIYFTHKFITKKVKIGIKFDDKKIPKKFPEFNKIIKENKYSSICGDIVNILLSNIYYEIDNNYIYLVSEYGNIVLIKDNMKRLLILFDKTLAPPSLTHNYKDYKIFGINCELDSVFDSYYYKNISNELLKFEEILKLQMSNAEETLILGMSYEIYFYLKFLSERGIEINRNSFIVVLGLTNILKNFINFKDMNFKDSKIINIYNDESILNSKNIVYCDIVYEIENLKSQKNLNTLIGYHHYLKNY